MKVAITMEYDGTRYHGSQIQKDVPTIQGELESALKEAMGEDVRAAFAGRTDQGVHAKGQVATFRSESSLTTKTIMDALNHYLPDDIVIRDASMVDDSFDPRRNALSREYRYSIWNDSTRSPLRRWDTYFVPQALDIDEMSSACQKIMGTHDFIGFASSLNGHKNTVRTVYGANVSKEGAVVTYYMEADAFLPHQVRNTMGALLMVGMGKCTVSEFSEILRCGRPASAGPTLPPHGLCLYRVNYPGDVL